VAQDINSVARAFSSVIHDAKIKAAANARANLIVELSAITLLIDAEFTTHEKAIHKITEIRQWLSERFPADDELDRRIADVVELLQHHAKGTKPQHRSHLSQMLAEKEQDL
jgi:hypothetical protein